VSRKKESKAVVVSSDFKAEKVSQVYRRSGEAEVTVAGQLAGGSLYCRNYKFKNALEHFPIDPQLRCVTKFFQFAKEGPLYVDELVSSKDDEKNRARELAIVKRKAAALKAEGLRYVYITKEMTLDDAKAQLYSFEGEMAS
jgi:hypothetical protein